MPIIYDKLYDKLKYIPTKALYNGGYYLDIFNGTPGYLTEASADKNIYLDPVTGKLEYRVVAWTPEDSTTALDLWLDGADLNTITATSGFVDQWDDKSGNGRHAVPVAPPASRPLTGNKTINGLNVIDGDGGGKWMFSTFSPAITLTTEAHIFQVREVAGPPNGEILFDITADILPLPRPESIVDVSSVMARHNTPEGGSTATGLTVPPAGNRIVYSKYVNASDVLERYLDGETTPQESFTFANASFTTETFDRSYLFCDITGGNDMLGGLGEFIIVLGPLSAGDRERIEGYLSWKWGILITDPAHPYVSKPPLIS